MPTISQLVRHGRKPKTQKVKAPALRKNWNSLRQRQVSRSTRWSWCAAAG